MGSKERAAQAQITSTSRGRGEWRVCLWQRDRNNCGGGGLFTEGFACQAAGHLCLVTASCCNSTILNHPLICSRSLPGGLCPPNLAGAVRASQVSGLMFAPTIPSSLGPRKCYMLQESAGRLRPETPGSSPTDTGQST